MYNSKKLLVASLVIGIVISIPVIGYTVISSSGFNSFESQPIFSDKTLVMGIFPRRNSVKTISKFKPIAKYISNEIGVKVEIQTANNFATFWRNVKEKKYDIVHYNQLHYILSNKSQGYSIILKNNEFGSSMLRPIIAVREDSEIKTIKDLKNKTIHFGGGRLAMLSHVASRVAIREQGINDSEYNWSYAKNPPAAAQSVYNFDADAAGLGNAVLLFPEVKRSLNNQKFRNIYDGPNLPHLPWAVSDKVSSYLSQKIQMAMMSLNDSDEGIKILKHASLSGFVQATDKEYDVVREIYAKYKKYNKAQK